MDYPGVVHTDGVGAMVSEIMGSSEPVTLIAIGPVPNLARALEREPRIAERVRFIGMHGSVRMGYNGGPTPQPECNVIHFVEDCRKVFEADWPMTITPLDTCGLVTLQDEEYQAVRSCKDPMIRALMENYDIWAAENGNPEMSRTRSSVLFDTVAAYLAVAEDLVEIEELGIRVTDEGMPVEDPSAKPVRCAMRWRSLPDFRKWLVGRLTE
jgi:inosine-uridine nucleoside N-ribohydrolase